MIWRLLPDCRRIVEQPSAPAAASHHLLSQSPLPPRGPTAPAVGTAPQSPVRLSLRRCSSSAMFPPAPYTLHSQVHERCRASHIPAVFSALPKKLRERLLDSSFWLHGSGNSRPISECLPVACAEEEL